MWGCGTGRSLPGKRRETEMFQSVGRILRWAKGYRKRMILGFVCSFFATWCTAGPVMLAAWALGQLIGNAWGEMLLLCNLVYRRTRDAGRLGPGAADRERLGRKRTPGLSSLAVPGRDRGAGPAAVLLHLLEEPAPGEYRHGAGGGPAHGAGECAETGVPGVLR